ncbi:MAG: thiamine diphosphokinase [Actinomycetota bacterium]
MSRTVLILAGGTTPSPQVLAALPPAAMCIAADSGIDHARHAGIVPDLAVGDFDSVSADGLQWADEHGVELRRHPAAKAQTDLELALDHALAAEPDHVVLAALGGGRFDHLLANFALLADRRYASVRIDGLVGTAQVAVIHDERELVGRPDELVSLLPTHGDVTGVTTDGLAYPLHDEPLLAGSSRGVSNYFLGSAASVAISDGVLLAVQPHRLDPGTAAGIDPASPGGR